MALMIRIYQDVPIHSAYVRNWLCKNIFSTVDLHFGRSPQDLKLSWSSWKYIVQFIGAWIQLLIGID